jgi:hypothetical protein
MGSIVSPGTPVISPHSPAPMKPPEEVKLSREDGELIGKQIQPCRFIFGNLDGTIVNAIIDIVDRDVEGLSQLRDGEITVNAARMRLTPLLQNAVLQANYFQR